MHKKIVIILAAAFLVAGVGAADAKGKWIKDQTGCKHWNSAPKPKETITWTGGCKNGKADGSGKAQWSEDGKPTENDVGEMRGGKLNGQATVTWANGEKYVGQWKNDKRHGQGTYTWANGNKYAGQWKNHKHHGQGTFTWGPGSKWPGDKYVGQWKNGSQHGQGTFTWADGIKYVGQWKNAKRHGQGTYTDASGSKYAGQYRDGKKHGQATLTWANGNHFTGEYRNDKIWNGSFYQASSGRTAQIANGRWAHNGKLVEP